VKRTSGKRLEEKTFDATVENIGAAAGPLKETLTRWLVQHAGATMLPAPDWHQALPPNDELDYLVRLEQQLAVVCKHFAVGSDVSLYGEREILDGALQLCLRHPSNPRVRMLYAQTLRQMKKSRPQIVSEYKDRTVNFHQKYPLDQEMNALLEKAYVEAFTV
jgi:hypothetical protein